MTLQDVQKKSTLTPLDTELLLAYTLGVNRSYIKAHPKRSLTLRQTLRFFWYARRRKRNVPIAYITGHKEFFWLDFEVNKHTLVPRPETEQMVSLALEKLEDCNIGELDNCLLIDLGTGSGCIPIALLHSVKNQFLLSNLQCTASDISKQALKIAKRNAKKHHVDITFKSGSLLEPWSQEIIKPRDQIIITANLPYITEEQWKSEASIKQEPKSALVAGEGGLALYRELLGQMQKRNIQSPISLYFEIDPDQDTRIEPLVKEYFRDARVILHEDLSGHTRIASIDIV